MLVVYSSPISGHRFGRGAIRAVAAAGVLGLGIGAATAQTAADPDQDAEVAVPSTLEPAQAQLAFTEESLQRGLNYLIGNTYLRFGAGLGLIDLNNDGHLDVVVLGATNGLVGVYENTGTGNFINRSFATGIGPIVAAGISAADYNADGQIDLYISGWLTGSRLLRNNGNMTFTDVTAAAGLTLVSAAQASAWSDFDADGWPDLYVTTRTNTSGNTQRNKFYRNNGNGTFTEMAGALGIDCENDPSLIPLFFDFDRDGLCDLYIGTDKGTGGVFRNRLFRNTGGLFTEITAQANAEAFIDCMGFAVGDVNFDGYFDVYMTNLDPGNKLFINNAGQSFVDMTEPSGLAAFVYSWATVFTDFDNDTHLDAYVCVQLGANKLYQGRPEWPYVEVGAAAGVALPVSSFSVAVGDVNGDHKPDMLVCDVEGRVKLFINRTQTDHHYARFKVVGQWPNTHAIGAQLDIRTGKLWQARQVYAGSNFKAMNEFTVHVGVADAGIIDEVIVRWPGTGDTRRLTNVPVNHQWTIHPPERLGDADADGRFSRDDARALFRAITGPGVPLTPGQEIFDLDGDFDIDADDLMLLAGRMDPLSAIPRVP